MQQDKHDEDTCPHQRVDTEINVVLEQDQGFSSPDPLIPKTLSNNSPSHRIWERMKFNSFWKKGRLTTSDAFIDEEDSCELAYSKLSSEPSPLDSHHHSHTKHPCSRPKGQGKKDSKKLVVAITIISVFFLVELLGGYITGSLGILSDAFHLLSDLLGFVLSWWSIQVREKRPDKVHTFGYYRYEAITSLFSIFLIWAITFYMFLEAISRFQNPQEIDVVGMLILSGVGVLANVVILAVLGHDHVHIGSSHSCSHEHQHSGHKSLAIKSAMLHALGDILSSFSVFVVAALIYWFPGMGFLDPCCTFVFSLIVFGTTVRTTKEIIAVLSEAAPKSICQSKLRSQLVDIPNVKAIDSLHIWQLSSVKYAASVRLTGSFNDPIKYSMDSPSSSQSPVTLYVGSPKSPSSGKAESKDTLLLTPMSTYMSMHNTVLASVTALLRDQGVAEEYITIQLTVEDVDAAKGNDFTGLGNNDKSVCKTNVENELPYMTMIETVGLGLLGHSEKDHDHKDCGSHLV